MSLCRTCFDICESDYSSPIEGDMKNMLQFCIPELDLDITENPVLCKPCLTTLIGVNEFKKKCLSTQKKILIFTNQSVKPTKPSPAPVETAPVLAKVIEKVAPFKLKLKNKLSDTPRAEYNTSNENQHVGDRKRRYSEIAVAPIVKNETVKSLTLPIVSDRADNDQEDFLSLLDNSNNVSDPKTRKLSPMSKNDITDFTKGKPNITARAECKLCKKSFKSTKYLHAHKMNSMLHKTNLAKSASVQTGGHLYRCERCSFATKYKIGLNKHYPNCPKTKDTGSSSEDSNGTQNTDSSLTCKVCSYVASSNAMLARHLNMKHDIAWTIYRCKRCDFHTTTLGKLRDHNRDVHPKKMDKNTGKENSAQGTEKKIKEKIFICSQSGCGKGFTSKQGWIHHQKKHSEYLKRECNVCKKQFENGRGFKAHMATHKKNKGVKTPGHSRGKYKKSAHKTDQKKVLNKNIENLNTNDAVEESESSGQILIRMDRVFSNIHIDNRLESNPASEETKQISDPEDKKSSVTTVEKENMDDIDQLSEDSSSRSEKNDIENERPMFEVEFVGTISDNEEESQDACGNKHQTLDNEKENQQVQVEEEEEEDQEMSTLSQETIIF